MTQHEDNLFQMLEHEHRTVEEIFQAYERIETDDAVRHGEVALEALRELEVHTRIEEEIFYPAVSLVWKGEGERFMMKSMEEHRLVGGLTRELRELDPGEEVYDAKFRVLMELVRRHVREEEDEIFPEAERRLAEGAEELLARMKERRDELVKSFHS